MTYDLIVIGGGFAGLTVANRAAELGLKPLVLEASADEFYPCNSRYSTGSVHVAFNPPRTPPDDLYAAIIDGTDGAARPDLASAIANRAADTIEWLRSQGAEFENHPRRTDDMPMLSPLREMKAGLDWEGSGANRLLGILEQKLTERGGELRRGVRATRIVVQDGTVAGVEAGAETFEAPNVAIADGGFQASPDLMPAHIGCAPSSLQQRNAGTGVGDGLRMATDIGAATAGMGAFYGHVLSRDAMTNERLWPYPQIDVICATSLIVDANGHRFVDEGYGGIHIANAIAKLDDPLGATAIFDSTVWEQARTLDNVPPNPSLPDAGGTVIEAGSIEELAEAAGIDRPGLVDTVATYNAHLSLGMVLIPPRTDTTYQPQPVVAPPFYAIPACAGITVTSGGLSVNGRGQVMDEGDSPIPGLFAAGSTVGGLEGGPRTAYLGGLIKSFAIGLIAAETIAASR